MSQTVDTAAVSDDTAIICLEIPQLRDSTRQQAATALRKRRGISCRPRHCVRQLPELEFQTLGISYSLPVLNCIYHLFAVKHNLRYGRTKPTEDLLTAP